jgi:hypothetical protein
MIKRTATIQIRHGASALKVRVAQKSTLFRFPPPDVNEQCIQG